MMPALIERMQTNTAVVSGTEHTVNKKKTQLGSKRRERNWVKSGKKKNCINLRGGDMRSAKAGGSWVRICPVSCKPKLEETGIRSPKTTWTFFGIVLSFSEV